MYYTIGNRTFFDMAKTDDKNSDGIDAGRVIGRKDVVFAAVLAALLAGLLVPMPAKVLDILWSGNLSLASAVILIALLAKNCSELGGSAIILWAVTVSRIALMAASARLIFITGSGGILIETFADAVKNASCVWIVGITMFAVLLATMLIFIITGRISDLSTKLLSEIIPLKKLGIETDMNAGVINARQGQILTERVDRESKFYLSIAGITGLLRTDIILAFLVLVITVSVQAAAAGSEGKNIYTSIQIYAPLVCGSAVLAVVPAVMGAGAFAWLLKRSYLSFSPEKTGDKISSQKVTIISEQTGTTEEVELLNPDFVETAEAKKPFQETLEKIVTFEPTDNIEERKSQTGTERKTKTPEEYYDSIAGTIESFAEEHGCVILAAESTRQLPVTVAVNAAVRVTQRGVRTLLVDTDVTRDAVAKVFDIEKSSKSGVITETCIDNLDVLSIEHISAEDKRSWQEDHSRIIIYAPNVRTADELSAITESADGVIVFAEDKSIYDKISGWGKGLVTFMPTIEKL